MKPLRVVRAGLVPYREAYEWQCDLHRRRIAGEIPDVLLLLEHPHVYTLGRRFSRDHLLVSDDFLAERGVEVVEADRGGSITYHGPGQIVGYPILDLRKPGGQPDAILYLRRLEEALIRTVRSYGVAAGRREGLTGVWVGSGKLAAIGVNVSRGVSKHGFALNVATDLSYFEGMVPCGILEARATSLLDLLAEAPPLHEVMDALVANLARVLHRVAVESRLEDIDLASPPGAEQGAPVVEIRARGTPPRRVRGEAAGE